MARHDHQPSFRRIAPAVVLLGSMSLTACQGSDGERSHRDSSGGNPGFDCTGANYFPFEGTNGYVRATALKDGQPVELEAVRISAPGTSYDERFAFDDDGVAFVSDDRPIPRRAGEITIRGVYAGKSDLCTTDYEPFQVFVPPPIEESQR